MKFTLTVTDASAAEIAHLLAAHLPIGTAVHIANTHQPQTAGDDDDNAPTNTTAPAVDSTGLPHDERIHSKAKTVTESGVWRKRKNLPDGLVATVEAELRARQSQTIPDATPMQPAAAPIVTPVAAMPMPPMPPQQPPAAYPVGPGYPPQPGNVQPGPLAATLPYQPQPMPPAQQPVQAEMPPVQQPMPPQQPAAMDFNGFMGIVVGKMQQKDASGAPLVDAPYLAKVTAEIAQAFQSPLNAITDIGNNPRGAEMVPYAVQLLVRDGKW